MNKRWAARPKCSSSATTKNISLNLESSICPPIRLKNRSITIIFNIRQHNQLLLPSVLTLIKNRAILHVTANIGPKQEIDMTVFKHRAPLLSGLLTLTLLGSGTAMADASYPSQAITFVVPYAAGGSSDTRSRMLAQKMSDSLGVTIVVENKPGASGNIGTSMIARAKPNGYTIGLGNFGPMSVNKALYGSNLPF